MKRGFFCIVVVLTLFAVRAIAQEKAGMQLPQAEWTQAGDILMHTPGQELFNGVIHPSAGLFEDYFDVDKAAAEHRGYIDMLLLHHPGAGDEKAYKAMEQYAEAGKIHSLGLSNWYVEELTEFLPLVTIMPALVQNEIHPYYQEQDVVPFIQEKGIVVQCWYPLGGRGYTADLLGNETIQLIAQAHGVSAVQVILRWDLQRGIVVIPGSSNPDHIAENYDIFDFELSDAEMQRIAAINQNRRYENW